MSALDETSDLSELKATNESGQKERVILAYSGGLDTSCILLWLIEQGFEVVCYTADVGQKEDWEEVREKAELIGAAKVFIENLQEDFLLNYIYPAMQCNSIYEDVYLMGTALARPCIVKRMVEIAEEENCTYLAHGCTGKGNDQVRFELGAYALNPKLKTIAPWRIPSFYNRFEGRKDLLQYAEDKGIPIQASLDKPYSIDENMMHTSYESGVLENPRTVAPKDMFIHTADPVDAKNEADNITIDFEEGLPVKITNNGEEIEGDLNMFKFLNVLGCEHGVGRIDMVENRFIGIKSRGVYETPGATILRTAHIDLEGIALDREVRKLRDMMAMNFSQYCYNGLWFSPEMDFVLQAMKHSQKFVTGKVDLQLYGGHVTVLGRESPHSLYNAELASMDVGGGYDPLDAGGFIRIEALRLRTYSMISNVDPSIVKNTEDSVVPSLYADNVVSLPSGDSEDKE